MKKILKNEFYKKFFLIILLIILFLFYTYKINLTNSDIGRHLKNGELFLKKGIIISSNFYSYTEPHYKTIDHHWGYGVFAYLIWEKLGFKGLSIFNTFLLLLAFLFFFKIAEEKSNYKLAYFFTLLNIPLIIYRKEIRPEMFSYLFLAIYYFLLTEFNNEKISYKKLIFLLIPLQLVWTNIHIFFVFGLGIVFFFTIESYLNNKEKLKEYSALLITIVFISLINPYFLEGLLEPFLILKNYGYLIAENMGVLFMQAREFKLIYFYFEIMFLLGSISFFISKKNFKKNILNILLFSFFGALAWKMIRGIALFGFILIPILSENFKEFYDKISKKQKRIILILVIIFLFFLFVYGLVSFFLNGEKGIGLEKGTQNSYNFFVENNLKGPVFNNYDIGSYLIFNLFPKEKVFVDNRPEAYPTEFFKNVYIPMQEKEEVWKQYQKKYNFNVIYFYRRDMTPWGQNFLIKRLKDPLWIPIYVDNYVIIYLKNTNENKDIIKKFKLPEKIFIINQLS